MTQIAEEPGTFQPGLHMRFVCVRACATLVRLSRGQGRGTRKDLLQVWVVPCVVGWKAELVRAPQQFLAVSS